MSWAGLPCPVAAGDVSFGMDLTMSSVLPAAVATADIQAVAVDQDAEQGICVSLHATKQVETIGGTLGLTWSDCGDSSTHGQVKDVEPAAIVLGEETHITGTGTLDKEITGGTYDVGVKAGGGLINIHFTGNNCEAKTFKLPLGIGSMSWAGLPCPVAAGDVSFGMDLTMSSV